MTERTGMEWFVVNAHPRQEALAEKNLARMGVEVFSPRIKQERIIRRRRQSVVVPLFPGYFFARFNLETHFRLVHYAHGVRGLVIFGTSPATVEDEVVESIRSKLEGSFLVVQPSPFQPGQTVRIEAGPFQGIEAVFEREMSDQQRVVLLLKTLSYQARVVVDLEEVAIL